MIVAVESAPVTSPPRAKEMLTVKRSGDFTEVRINSSSLGIILACPRKAYYALHRRLHAKQESAALVFGRAIHKALEVFYSAGKKERVFPPNFSDHAVVIAEGTPIQESGLLYRSLEAFVAEAAPLRELSSLDKHSIQAGVWMLCAYFKAYIDDPYVVHVDEQGPVVERTCEATLCEDGHMRIILFGTIDVILRSEVTGEILPADHKTATYLGSDFYNRIKPNHQYSGYLWLAQQCLGVSSQQFMVNVLQKKARPLTAKGGPPNFARQITSRSEQDLIEFRQAVQWAVEAYLEWHGSGAWPIGHVDACAQYGGCQFLEVCSAPSELRENLIEAKFEGGSQ